VYPYHVTLPSLLTQGVQDPLGGESAGQRRARGSRQDDRTTHVRWMQIRSRDVSCMSIYPSSYPVNV